ncbi:MAG TPA: hypothetical protein VF212_00460 [Longimicrobiales bacterium]
MKRWTATMRAPALLLLPLTFAACGDEAAPEDIAAGSYTLESANGEPLPTIAVTWEDPSGTWEARILSGTLTLADGDYTAEFIVDLLVNGEPSLEATPFEYRGRYDVSGDRVTLHASDETDDDTVGTLEGDVLTVSQSIEDYGTFSAVYRRE